MKQTVAIFGSGMMTPGIIDYYTHKYPCQILIATIDLEQARAVVGDNPNCKIIEWSMTDTQGLDHITEQADVVIPMVPEHVLLVVAQSCLRTKTHMVYTAYQEANIFSLSEEAQAQGVLLLSEMGEDPGLDHLCTLKLLDEVKEEGGKVLQLGQWGAGLPDHVDNNNPIGYKFSWSPSRLYVALQATSYYLANGQKIQYEQGKQYEQFEYLDTKWGTFESVGHRDVGRYIKAYGLEHEKLGFFRGLLRHAGYCNMVNTYLELGLLDAEIEHDYTGKTCADIMATLVKGETSNIKQDTAKFLGVKVHDDTMHRLQWLGLFEATPAPIECGTHADYLLAMQLKRMMYAPTESDITLIMIRMLVEYADGSRALKEATLRVAGIPGGFSAMARAVGYSAGIAGKHVLKGGIEGVGCIMLPELPELCSSMRAEMAEYGFEFEYKTTPLALGDPGFTCAALSK